ncbi:MAG: aldose 1-epimerase, partial [Spirochaetaceae bacterium]|nr:aldose 1-epimerase [Spirochaetaceae bacterium]
MPNKEISFLKLTNPETKESLELCPTRGGTITSLILGKGFYQILDSDSDKELQKNPLFRGRFLFPFNDRIPEGKYTFTGKDYQLPINCNEDSSAIHGFMYNREVSILKHTETEAVFYWRTGKKTIQGYPFDISLQTEIELHNGGVKISFTVKNEDIIPAPYAFGWHSYFKTDPSSILTADYPFYYDIDDNYLPVGKGISTKGSKFDFSNGNGFSNKILDHTFRASLDGKSVLKNKNYSIQIKQTNFAYTQLFIPPDKKSIAIEPISSKPNSFN